MKNSPVRMRRSTLAWLMAAAMLAGYLIGLWQQAAQKQARELEKSEAGNVR